MPHLDVKQKISNPMAKKWICPDCGESVAESYAECWNCQSTRPGYDSPAVQMKRNEEMQAEMIRQIKVADENQQRVSKLLDRWEKLTDALEIRLDT